MYPSRNLLHAKKLCKFLAYALSQGYTREATKGDFEVLRLRNHQGELFILHRRLGAVHITVPQLLVGFIRRWIRDAKREWELTHLRAKAKKEDWYTSWDRAREEEQENDRG